MIPLILIVLAIYVFLQNPGFFLGMFFLILCFLTIFFVARKKRRKIRLEQERERIFQSGINKIDVMEGVEFEGFLEALFSEMGFRVETTATTGDFGADLILTSHDGERIAVQAKRYSQAVGVDAVQEVYSAKTFYECTEA